MHELPPLNPLERELESRLGRLTPAHHRIGRDELMFRAGQAAGLRSARQWRSATLTTLAMLLLGLASTAPWIVRNNGDPARNLASNTTTTRPPLPTPNRHSPASPQVTTPVLVRLPSVATAEYLRLREQVLREGVEALPAVRWAPLPETTGITAGSWRPRTPAGDQADNPFWQGNLNNRSKRS